MRQHLKSCKILADVVESNPKQVPNDIIATLKKPKRTIEKKQHQCKIDLPKLRAKLVKGGFLGFYPCSRCIKPCTSMEVFEKHLSTSHGVSLY